MGDLSEHLGTILAIMGVMWMIILILVGALWRDKNLETDAMKKELKEIRSQDGDFKKWLGDQTPKGGLVTRDDYYEWCKNQQEGCGAVKIFESISEWRNEMLAKGGPLLRVEHTELCEHITDRMVEKIEKCFLGHREWVADRLQLIQATVDGKVLRDIGELRKDMELKIKEVDQGIHDELKEIKQELSRPLVLERKGKMGDK